MKLNRMAEIEIIKKSHRYITYMMNLKMTELLITDKQQLSW